MSSARRFTAIVRREGPGFVALCVELDVASQGSSAEEACAQLRSAIEHWWAVASPEELRARLGGETVVTELEVAVG